MSLASCGEERFIHAEGHANYGMTQTFVKQPRLESCVVVVVFEVMPAFAISSSIS